MSYQVRYPEIVHFFHHSKKSSAFEVPSAATRRVADWRQGWLCEDPSSPGGWSRGNPVGTTNSGAASWETWRSCVKDDGFRKTNRSLIMDT